NQGATTNTAQFFQPSGIAEAGGGVLVVTDHGNHRVKAIFPDNTGAIIVTNLYGVSSNDWAQPLDPASDIFPGWWDGTTTNVDVVGTVEARLPYGVVVAADGTVYTSEDYYHVIRAVTGTGLLPPPPPPPGPPQILNANATYGQVTLTWTASTGATNYDVKRSTSSGGPYTTIASTTSTSYTDTTVISGTTYYYVVSASNTGGESANSSEVSVTVPIPPPDSPSIGWFDYEGTPTPVTVFHAVSGGAFTTHNDLLLAISPNTSGVATYYTTDGSNPNPTNGSTPPFYQDGLLYAQPLPVTTAPDLTIKAVNAGPGGSSAIVTAEFIFQVGNPIILGNNAAQFSVTNVTSGAQMYYTTDGSDPDPTNAVAIGPISSGTGLSLQVPADSNLTFKIRGFRADYQPSAIITQIFSSSNFVANAISFGFASGEASSDFVASPGQIFYAPVTLSVLPSQQIYSLQFNLTVTNVNSAPAVFPGAYGFQSFLVKPDTANPGYNIVIPPAVFLGYATNATYTTNTVVDTNSTPPVTNVDITTNYVFDLPNPPPTNQEFIYNGEPFLNAVFTNDSENLLGVGWLERAGETNLYNTKSQDLIQYSQAHDTTFLQSGGKVILGGYAFYVPPKAVMGQTNYEIRIGRPSATSDGIGRPGSSVYIATPTNGALIGSGLINSIKDIVIGTRKYIAGDCAPFRWFNAGDFGNTNLDNADVEQVFQSAIYSLNYPPPGSDFFDSMDSCGTFGVTSSGQGYYTADTSLTASNEDLLFDGNDTTINQIAFGDGKLDVCDVYVTFRRSLDPGLWWWRRYYTNGVLVAEPVPNTNYVTGGVVAAPADNPQPQINTSSTNSPQVNFAATDVQGSAGQTVQIPITANILGSYPLRLLMLNLTVVPLDGSPPLTAPISFSPNPALGTPALADSTGNDNYAAAWLNSAIAGLTGNVTVGTLTVTIPTSATSLSAYAVHFDHASASPNGLASFPKQTLTGLITLSSRANSTYNDGIPDSWRLRWFGTVYNLLSVSNACPSGDGVNNWQKYVAGVDPNLPNDFPSLHAATPLPSGTTAAISWPSVAERNYVIERSATLFPADWTPVATNSGTGTDMEFDDSITGNVYFYRVRISP
ncbi:MAG: chitobiase/beta-hexosaminidase C-terminal domain-containing protein, partial [Verrucomicrobiota bacterium]|nr:chitobiase/beta-hexosaminidase C-terminal domain-containing protein [Verrucomicrobiota bacterium]